MRSLFALILAATLATSGIAQQQQASSNEQPQQQSQPPKKPAKQSQQPAKQEEQAAKPTEPAPPQPEPKAGDDKKEEHFDMTEIAPVVTHHQVSLDGKTLKYTATAGRLPINRGLAFAMSCHPVPACRRRSLLPEEVSLRWPRSTSNA